MLFFPYFLWRQMRKNLSRWKEMNSIKTENLTIILVQIIGMDLWSEQRWRSKTTEKELDELKANGITNLRILVGAEGGKQDFTVTPALQSQQGKYDENLLDGLDYLLSEMGKRNMDAVLYLNNNWEWSGGMAQYLEWNGKGTLPNPNVNRIRGHNLWIM